MGRRLVRRSLGLRRMGQHQLRCWRIRPPAPRPTAGNSHGDATSDNILSLRLSCLHFRPAPNDNRLLQHHRRQIWLRGLRSHRVPRPLPHRQRILLRRPKRHHLHQRPPRLRRGQRRFSPRHPRPHRHARYHSRTSRPDQPLPAQIGLHKDDAAAHRRLRRRTGIHANQRHGCQRGLNNNLHHRRRVWHSGHFLRSRGLHLLLPDRAGTDSVAGAGTISRETVSDVDQHADYFLLRVAVLTVQGGVCQTGPDCGCDCFCGGGDSGVVLED